VGFKNSTESDCHREGKVLFENGECYNLLERGPCFEESMWLVMTVEGNGDLRAECRPRKCSDSHFTQLLAPKYLKSEKCVLF